MPSLWQVLQAQFARISVDLSCRRRCRRRVGGPRRIAPPPAQRLQPFLPPPHLNVIQMRCHPGADARRRAMEIAAVLMFAAAVMGFVQQFDNQSW